MFSEIFYNYILSKHYSVTRVYCYNISSKIKNVKWEKWRTIPGKVVFWSLERLTAESAEGNAQVFWREWVSATKNSASKVGSLSLWSSLFKWVRKYVNPRSVWQKKITEKKSHGKDKTLS